MLSDVVSDVEYWIRNLDEHGAPGVQKVLIGNKIDLQHKRKVPAENAQALADRYGMSYFETSAKDGENVEGCFLKISKQIIEKFNLKNLNNNAINLSKNKLKIRNSKCC
jgi:GTPase SAR1 family protein